jgi:hypothetical protein
MHAFGPQSPEPTDREVGVDPVHDDQLRSVSVRRSAAWSIEHEPDSDTYLLLDSADAYCAELHWTELGECWAHFEPYVAFAGPTTIADIEALQELADLLRGMPKPEGHPFKECPRRRDP